ncbi:uncharacterized protein N7506_011661 [Penicillium brevicompactum]|uniref:uncharacterized protein n=1 Tax=Penicillium brevicompactum TaxID=5074 RepID=UPI0025409EE2|nr:uncharacterized protein N7506_011661 [Penicillium brevicompactum]KAJ5318957.1 hypothetical protein N7506_011661 [Penicillium brevicompactum]
MPRSAIKIGVITNLAGSQDEIMADSAVNQVYIGYRRLMQDDYVAGVLRSGIMIRLKDSARSESAVVGD